MGLTIRHHLYSATILLALLVAGEAVGKIYYSKKEAMTLAFGEQARVEMQSLFLTEKEIDEIQRRARVKVESALYTFYVGRRGEEVLGYAAIETHTVRTRPETLLVVLTPEGALRHIEVLAFHEPPEYQPSERWLEQLYQKPLAALDFNHDVQAITGATLSSRSTLDSARKVLAVFEVAVKGKQN